MERSTNTFTGSIRTTNKSTNIYVNILDANEKTLRTFAAIKDNELKKLDRLITDSKRNFTNPEFPDDINDIIEFGKPNRLNLQNPVNGSIPNLNANGPQHPYELDVLAAAVYYSTEEDQDAFDKLFDYAKIIITDENKLKNIISDTFWIASRYGKLKIIEKLIPEKPGLKNLARWYIPEPVSPPTSAFPLSTPLTTSVQPEQRRMVRAGNRSVRPIVSNNVNTSNNIYNTTYHVNCDAFQIAVIANHMNIVKVLLYFNFPCNNTGMILYPPNIQANIQNYQALPPYIQGHDAQQVRNTALGFARYIGNKELESILMRTIYLQDAKQFFANKNYPLATSCFSLACAFDLSDFKNQPKTFDSKEVWLQNLSFVIDYLHIQVENAVAQNASVNGDSQDYRFVLDFIKIFVNLFNKDSNFELLYKEFLEDVIGPLYAYDCSSSNTNFKLFESNEVKESFFNQHNFLSSLSFGKTHSEMQGQGSSILNSTNIGFFGTAPQDNSQSDNNNSSDSIKNNQTLTYKTS